MKNNSKSNNLKIPTGWKYLPFGEVFEFIQSLALSREQLTFDEHEGEIFNIHYGDIHATYKTDLLDFNKEEKIPRIKNIIESKTLALLKEGDLIIADASEDYKGVAANLELKNIESRKVTGGLHTFVARDNSELTVKGFRTYVLKNPAITNALKKLATGSKVYGVSKTNLATLNVFIPTKKEQIKISQILSAWNTSIETLEQLVAKKERNKRALIQQLLSGKKRFKEFKLEKWKNVTLKDCCIGKGEYGINAPAVPFSKSLPRYLRITDIDDDGLYTKNSEVSVDDPNSNKYVLKKGDIVFARTGNTTGKTYKYNTNDGELVYAGFLIKFSPNPKILITSFLKYFSESEIYWNWVKVTSTRSGQPGINGTEYGQLELLLPSIKEQERITSVLLKIDEEIQTLKKQLNHYRLQKQGIMQVLLTGEKIVKV